jgi:hypothetical protein
MNESPQNQPHSTASTPSDEWETVNFPDALSVDQLPEQPHESPVSPTLVSGDFYLKVQSQNQELRSQVAELEAALLRSQGSLRAEMERWEALALAQSQADPSETSESRLAQQTQALSGSQARLGQLFVELESSHRMAQRQQILVETLTEQLQNSHEQIAQLERECAAVQQRASESLQQVSQSEQTNRDLRSRLHRQQRYTLQFKAALEKCLDVPPATAQGFVADFLEEPDSAPIAATAPKVKIPRSQPVQPWGVASTVEEAPALQSWANAIVDDIPDESTHPEPETLIFASETPIEGSVVESVAEPIASVKSVTELNESLEELDLDQVERNPNLDEAERLDNWAQVIAQVNAIMGEEITIVEQTSEDQSPEVPQARPPIAPLIAKAKPQNRESMAAIDLPSFPKHDR